MDSVISNCRSVVVPARTRPLANAPAATFVSVGPSSTARVYCVTPPVTHAPSAGRTGACVTDRRGQVTFRWRTPAAAAPALRRGRDTIRVFVDRDRDGVYDPDPSDILSASAGAEPSATFDVDIAKAVNYVALGDSYSSGEAGEVPPTGLYQTGVSDADSHCRRWSEAYPNVFARDVLGDADLGINVIFATYACTGAATLNVYNAADPDGTSTEVLIAESNRPSHAVPRLHFRRDVHGVVFEKIVPDGWEPRQSVSLAGAQAMGDVDMITITIGGNDAGFAKVLEACVLGGGGCGRNDLFSDYSEIPARLRALLAELKRVAPGASIFVLGYPHITPEPIEANRELIADCGLPGMPLHVTGVQSSLLAAAYHRLRLGSSSDLTISYSEARFLWDVTTELNDVLRRTAAARSVEIDVLANDHDPNGDLAPGSLLVTAPPPPPTARTDPQPVPGSGVR
ncbi:hypothetical protein [Candidatus Poriferisodalis sp.]|uniref:hypothetical protein n=1 Tax=Candidatus Poriferisodalis sp. TaxID=3101277 RepID=UPI003B02EB52